MESKLEQAKEILQQAKATLSQQVPGNVEQSNGLAEKVRDLHQDGALTYEQYCEMFDEFRNPPVRVQADIAMTESLQEAGIICAEHPEIFDEVIQAGREVEAQINLQPS